MNVATTRAPTRLLRLACALAAVLGGPHAMAARLDPDGRGQALVFPYYSAQTGPDGTMNTYLSIVNGTSQGKALRVRFRESRVGQEVGWFNLYLSPNDMWTAAVVPVAGGGTTVLTSDVSCTDPSFTLPAAGDVAPPPQRPLRSDFYSSDGMGSGLDRTREGYVEVIEMATLAATTLAYATHDSAGLPNCGRLRNDPEPRLGAPTGGLSGTLTLIDVNRGFDFTLRAEAIAELSTRPFFRLPGDPYPGFDAAEVDPWSVVASGPYVYRSAWSSGAEAVDAVFMRPRAEAEYVLERGTRSKSDFVVTFPTRHLRLRPDMRRAPFTGPPTWSVDCAGSAGEPIRFSAYNRESAGGETEDPDFPVPGTQWRLCANANVVPVARGDAATSSVLLSRSLGYSHGEVGVRPIFDSGWLQLATGLSATDTSVSSLPSSTRVDTRSGAVVSGAHRFRGLPMTGFSVRTFENGTLSCGGSACQGNYGGSFAAGYVRDITGP